MVQAYMSGRNENSSALFLSSHFFSCIWNYVCFWTILLKKILHSSKRRRIKINCIFLYFLRSSCFFLSTAKSIVDIWWTLHLLCAFRSKRCDVLKRFELREQWMWSWWSVEGKWTMSEEIELNKLKKFPTCLFHVVRNNEMKNCIYIHHVVYFNPLNVKFRFNFWGEKDFNWFFSEVRSWLCFWWLQLHISVFFSMVYICFLN